MELNTDSKLSRRSVLRGLASVGAANAVPRVLGAPQAKTLNELLAYDALGLAGLVKTGAVSPTELLDAALKRIDALDGDINAMTTVARARALNAAESSPSSSVFSGVPTVVKDLIDVAGIRRTNGSLLNLSHTPKQSPAYVQAMENAGLNILGMTNAPEFASIALTDNHAFGATRNPWDLDHSSGGSSGGSAAAVAAGYVPLAHGTDGGGSNRIPASCCGVLGMKASRYRQLSGESDGKHLYLRTHQCLSRSVRDSAALLAATENRSNHAGYAPVGFVEGPAKRRLRIALNYENCFAKQAVPSVREAISKTAQLCESLGHDVSEVPYPIDGKAMFDALEGIMLSGMPNLLGMVESITGKPAEDAGVLTPALIALGRYAAALPAGSHQKGMTHFAELGKTFKDFFSQYDVWLTPVIPIETPLVGYVAPDSSPEIVLAHNRELLSYTALANGIGAPAMSVPLYHSTVSGLPIGSHFTAAPGADRSLYELAYELEAALPWANRWAPHSAGQIKTG